jgi:hypothetical protein
VLLALAAPQADARTLLQTRCAVLVARTHAALQPTTVARALPHLTSARVRDPQPAAQPAAAGRLHGVPTVYVQPVC